MNLLAAIGWKVLPRIDLGPIEVSPHGLGIAAGYGAGGALTARRAERIYGIARDHVWNMLMWAVAGVVVGARLFYVVGHIGDYIPDDPLGVFRVWEGGIVFYGGAFGGILAAVPYMRKHKLRFWHVMDAAAPGFPLGLILGRIGDLIIGDHLGSRTDFFLGFEYRGGEIPGCPNGSVDPCFPIGTVLHQTALYDLLSVLVLFPVVMLLARKRRSDGFLIMFVATWYGAGRFLIDFARTAPTYLGLRGTQWVSLTLIVLGVTLLVRITRRGLITEPLSEISEPSPVTPEEPPGDEEDEVSRMLDEGSPTNPS